MGIPLADLARWQGLDENATFTRVKVTTVAAAPLVLKAALVGSYTRLHALWGTMTAADTLTIEDSDGMDLSGAMPIGTNGGYVIPPCRDKDLVLITAIDKGISLLTPVSTFHGYAIVSQSTTP